MDKPGDLELIARARAQDEAAFEGLLRPLIEPAARLAFGMLHDRAAAEDAVQEAALKAWRRLDNLRPNAGFRPWFFGIVVNESRSIRRLRWWSELKLQNPAAARAGTDDAAERGEDLRRALRRLPHDQRAALLLHFYIDLPLDDVAAALGISVAGVKSRINRGLKRMRSALPGYEPAL